jgi:lipopolysaccharide transport protein LptA
MKIISRIILIIFLIFIASIFYWAIYAPKPDVSERIYKTLKEQEKTADLAFKDVTFEEIVAGVKYWQLKAQSAMVNKDSGIATLKTANGTFFKKGQPVLRFKSPAALWDMKKKEILLDKPLGYDIKLERTISALIKTLEKSRFSIFNLPEVYKKEGGYWFQSNNLSWKLEDQKLLCTGGIILNKGDLTGYAQQLEGDVELERILLKGNPKIVIFPNDLSPITVEASVFEVISAQDTIIARGNPKIFWQDSTVKSDTLKYLQGKKVLELTGNVSINYNDIQAWSNNASYFTETREIVLVDNAKALQGTNELSGDKIMLSLLEKKLSVIGRGKVVITKEENETP